MPIKVILIFDIGKTNKKYLLFDEQFNQLQSAFIQISEIKDDDGFVCDDLVSIVNWVLSIYEEIRNDERYELAFINFSTYGATMVHLDETGKPCTPLYNYLKELPAETANLFEKKYGPIDVWSLQTASPYLGMLNAGLQLFWLKYKKAELFYKIRHSLFLPQYFCYLFSGELVTDFTGIGCHTGLWDFSKHDFHAWAYEERLTDLLPPIHPSSEVFNIAGTNIKCGVGIHDSSAALVPYIEKNKAPFILLSTGTWCITINPFNEKALTKHELKNDTLCYLSFNGNVVKASRLFAGNEHEIQVKRLAAYFNKELDFYKNIKPNAEFMEKFNPKCQSMHYKEGQALASHSVFAKRELTGFKNYEEAYHQLIADIIVMQVHSSSIVMHGSEAKKLFVDGGFSNNLIYMQLLVSAFSEMEVYSAKLAQASSLGAALVMRSNFNSMSIASYIKDINQIL